ncbi:hypothetical protein LTR62_004109 [Meristemomyces frigidus]|uniref:Major facilitator superfamily (MFS) profile domain-containing protein n=1 Tax=Meristemomyces frigidus TaxID=1508187 RepID=A0AAN7TNV2_9PEZI|nr:hypothetical protein LTR62_004109 [Meristemomyces frigidus]
MTSPARVAAVTGANKGIGLAIVRNLALQYPKSPLHSGPFLIYLTARSAERGAEAVQALNDDAQLKQAKVLARDGGNTTITFRELDISRTESIQDFSAFLKQQHPNGLDIVINNAGIALQGFDAKVVQETLKTNYYGTLEATQDLLPLLKNGGRLVNVSSMAGQLNKYSEEIRNAFLQASKTDVAAVTTLMEKFHAAVAEGKEKEAGFPSAAYAVSKAGETAYTKVIAMEEAKRNRGVLINACCPGYVKTDMTKGGGAKTPDQGAQTPVMLALHDIGGRTGGFWQSEREIEWMVTTALTKPFRWFYKEFGLVSIHETGRNAYLIILARACRMFAYGTTSLILALFFAELQFSDFRIGLFMTLTLLGDVLLGLLLTLIADRFGRRKILFFGSFLMVLSGAAFAIFENFWVLLAAAVVGVVSATGGDFGPFRAIEESVLAQLTGREARADVLAWYVTLSTVGSAGGSEASGRIVNALLEREGWTLVDVYLALFWLFTVMGFVNAALVLLLTEACELPRAEAEYAQVAQDERGSVELDEHNRGGVVQPSLNSLPSSQERDATNPWWRKLTSSFSAISPPTRSVMYKLWTLLAIDSIADGMVPYSLTNYYIDHTFHPSVAFLGDITSAAYFLGAISAVFAGPLARKIGLIHTMVFTHIPSSAAVLVFGLPTNLVMVVMLLLVRAGLNNMDQAPRSAFIAAVVQPEERTAVMGITNLLRTLAAMTGPSVTGVLAGSNKFWVAFFVAGSFRLAYDVGLWGMFRNLEVDRDEGALLAQHGRLEDEETHELDRRPAPLSLASDDFVDDSVSSKK